MKDILDFFKKITEIEHCSYNTSKLKEYLITTSKEFGYFCKSDNASNILIYKSNHPKVCFQAHYDMVCVGTAPDIKIIQENGFLKAKNSSLGADNAIAIAMMLKLMKDNIDAEFLFTNDEEVGLIGAKNLNLDIKSKYILNLDSEDEASVFIGCAGGVDLTATKKLEKVESKKSFYEIEVYDLPGGHSGVDIDKNIPNAIIILINIIKESNAFLCEIKGGVATNAIPSYAKAVVSADYISEKENLKVKKLNNKFDCYNLNCNDILNCKNGVIDYNKEFNVVQNSSNLGLISFVNGELKLDISMRSMDNKELERLSDNKCNYYKNLGYKVKLLDKYPAWKPEVNEFTNRVKTALYEVFKESKELVIHAGLECGILSQKYPNAKIASIGPNINYPHSTNEKVEIESIKKTFQTIKILLKEL